MTSDYDKTVNTLSQAAAEKAVFCLHQRAAQGQRQAGRRPAPLLGGTARAHAQAAADIKWWTTDRSTRHAHQPADGLDPDSRIRGSRLLPDRARARR